MSFEDTKDQLDKTLDAVIAGQYAAAEAARQAAIAAEKSLEAAQQAVKACQDAEDIANKSSSLLRVDKLTEVSL